MRTDARIDRRAVKLPYRSTLGFDKLIARVGDMVLYREHYMDGTHSDSRIARVAGRVKHAPALEGDSKPVRNFLLVITMSEDLTYAMERWIDPVDVQRCWRPQSKHAALMAFMLGEEFHKFPVDELRAWTASGFETPQEFRDYRENRSK